MKMTSKRLLSFVTSHTRRCRRLMRPFYCWYASERLGITWTEAEKIKLREAQALFEKARKLTEEVLVQRVGTAAVIEAKEAT